VGALKTILVFTRTSACAGGWMISMSYALIVQIQLSLIVLMLFIVSTLWKKNSFAICAPTTTKKIAVASSMEIASLKI